MRYLLVGNGPSALARQMGVQIDQYPGLVVRFNAYKTRGFEECVGSRTDVWATVGDVGGCRAYKHQQRWWMGSPPPSPHDAVRERLGCTILSHDWKAEAQKVCGSAHPSSGLMLTAWLLAQGHEVELWGFDFMDEWRQHHYADKADRGPWHDGRAEWIYFMRQLEAGTVRYLGWDPATESTPAVRAPTPCGSDTNISNLRDPGQMGWYQWIADRVSGLSNRGAQNSILDVGAGTCAGLRLYKERGLKASGHDEDVRLRSIEPDLLTGHLANIETMSFDFVSCVDVLEHVMDDITFFKQLCRIARRCVFITTPNGGRSHAVNSAHCRELTFAQYLNVFKPDEVYTGSPCGTLHVTHLLSRVYGRSGQWYADLSAEGPDNSARGRARDFRMYRLGRVPLEVQFTATVDGLEWPHIVGEHWVGS